MTTFKRALMIVIKINAFLIYSANIVAAPEFLNEAGTRVNKAYHSKQWKELPDEALIPASKIKWNRLAKAALNLPEWMEFSLSQRTRFESVSHPWRNGQSSDTDVQLPLQSRIHVGVNHGPFWVMFEGQDSRTHFAGARDFNTNTVTNQFDVLQLFGSATLRNINNIGLRTDFHIGRITMHVGSGRLVGRNGYRNTTNSFDGAHFVMGNDKDWRVRTFLTSPVQIDPTHLDESSNSRLFWGAVFETSQLSWLNGEAYYYGINDKKDPAKTRTFSTFGIRGYQSPAKASTFTQQDFGKVDYEFEGAAQTGKTNSKDLFAYMGHAELGYTFNTTWFPRFNAEYDYASGTNNPNGNNNHTFDRLFGVRRSDMMETGIFGPFFRSNIESVGTRFTLQPRDDLKLFAKHHVWYLAQAKDAFVGSNLNNDFKPLSDKTGSAGRFLGHDIELVGSWKLKSNVVVEAGYIHWFKGDYFDRLPASAGLPANGQKDSDYFFVSTELRF
ncbi:alginate export family protein [Crenothrix sp.]|uniref:alginate export family protein n=1 Tax=Crenothrix sp. TaxID=3100433 RepID=UPI00374D16CE